MQILDFGLPLATATAAGLNFVSTQILTSAGLVNPEP